MTEGKTKMAPQPDDLILRLPAPTNAERDFILSEGKRLGLSMDSLFLHWMQQAKAASSAA